jgi:adenylate cyclase
VPLVIEYEGNTYPGLALAAVLAATGVKAIALRARNQNTTSLDLTTGTIPLDGRSNLLLRYRGKRRSFPYVSAAEVLAGRDARAVFNDAVVFVGTTAVGSREVVSTPFDNWTLTKPKAAILPAQSSEESLPQV